MKTRLPILLIGLSLLTGCSTSSIRNSTRASTRSDFLDFVARHPQERLFTSKIEQRTRDCLHAYKMDWPVAEDLYYGESVRSYRLAGKSVQEVKRDMERMGCAFKDDVLRSPADNKPKLFDGHTLPLWIFVCPDGGVIRVKPQGDPSNPYHPQVQGTKALRYPAHAKYETFSDEVVKVDDEGNAIPKSRDELEPEELVEGWSLDAHVDLTP